MKVWKSCPQALAGDGQTTETEAPWEPHGAEGQEWKQMGQSQVPSRRHQRLGSAQRKPTGHGRVWTDWTHRDADGQARAWNNLQGGRESRQWARGTRKQEVPG